MPEVTHYSVQVTPVQGFDPTVFAQIAQLAATEAAELASKNWIAAVMTGLQIVALIAGMFAPTPPVPTPTNQPIPSELPPHR